MLSWQKSRLVSWRWHYRFCVEDRKIALRDRNVCSITTVRIGVA